MKSGKVFYTLSLVWILLQSILRADDFSSPEFAAALQAATELTRACEADHGNLWGIPLCGRLMLVDPGTRRAVLTQPDPDHQFRYQKPFFLGILPQSLALANTSVRWKNESWAMVMLPLPQSRFDRLMLLTHESFHRLQPELNLSEKDVINDQLDTEQGRIWLRLELRALAQAMRSSGDSARQSVADAMLFRAYRNSLFPDSAQKEAALEIQEGLAESTGAAIALQQTGEVIEHVARQVESAEDSNSFVRSFAYATGPALGFLLDRYSQNWRVSIAQTRSLSNMLTTTVALPRQEEWADQARKRAISYGYRAVEEAEHDREANRQAQMTTFQKRFVDGPVLSFPKSPELQRSFNPNNLMPFPQHGTVYPTGTFAAHWGKLKVEGGALLSPDNQSLVVSAPTDTQARPLRGSGWELELTPGWTIRPGSRSGNYQIAPEQQ